MAVGFTLRQRIHQFDHGGRFCMIKEAREASNSTEWVWPWNWQKHTKRAITIGHFPQNRIEYSSKLCSQTHGNGHILMTKGQGGLRFWGHISQGNILMFQGELGFLEHSSDHGQATQGYREYSHKPMVLTPLWPMVPHFFPICFEPKGTHSHLPMETSILGSLQSFRFFVFCFFLLIFMFWGDGPIKMSHYKQ